MEKYDNFFLVKCPCSKTSTLVFEQGHLSRKNLSMTIFATVNYLSSALLKENLSYFSFTLLRKTCWTRRKVVSAFLSPFRKKLIRRITPVVQLANKVVEAKNNKADVVQLTLENLDHLQTS